MRSLDKGRLSRLLPRDVLVSVCGDGIPGWCRRGALGLGTRRRKYSLEVVVVGDGSS